MNQAIETLKTEHRLIEQVLGSLETFVDRMDSGEEVDRARIAEYADFFKNFADKCHHAKEEDRLFAAMVQHGFPKEYGPIAVMLADHEEGRSHVRALAEVGAASGPLGPEEKLEISRHAMAYIPLLRAHIQKEDNILYPMAEQAIPRPLMEAMAEEFEAFEKEEMGEGTHERFHALAESLIGEYQPDEDRMAAGSACVGCAGHM